MRKTVLIIGGYGQFGGRLSRRLSDIADITVMVAGRTLPKAEALCAEHGGNLRPVFFDSRGDLDAQLTDLKPWLVIDAAGPFQSVFGHGYELPETCIRHGIHYIDLSDSGTFTQGIGKLDAKAKAAGVTLISGASSVPALSSAVVDAAKPRLARITSIEGGISPGGKIDIGTSVTQAVLSYLGKPLKIFRGGAWASELGYSRVHAHTIALKGEKPLRRKFGLCDAPDLLLFPEHYKGVETVRFYGSQELWLIHFNIRILAWLQKRGIVRNLQNHAKLFSWIGTKLGRFASERGGMYMRILGVDGDGAPISQHWHLIAEDGDGPFIPTLAAEILTRRWLEAEPTAGARAAVSEITLSEFEHVFSSLAIKSEFADIKPAPYLFQQVLGADFDKLPEVVRFGHEVSNTKIMHGRVDVVRGKNPLAQLAASIIGFAKTGTDRPITISMDVRGGHETWIRTIDGKAFRSTLSKGPKPYEIYERFGPIKFKMKFRIADERLHYDIVSAKMLGIPFPKFLLPKSITHEREQDGKFIFDVEIRLPLLGRLIAYKGWLA
ncbi:MAG: DUF4166 domain-containing protein [Robiginitomaculum sp.]|nr:DUF4166 domain-containing protein [Robiginitomaculum sp.]